MKKVKILTVFLFMVIALTGCFPKEKPVSNLVPNNSIVKSNSDSPAVNSNPNNVKTVTIKPQKPIIKINKPTVPR